MTTKSYRFVLIVVIILSAFLLAYTTIRAYKLVFTHDESLSYIYAISTDALTVLNLAYRDANNHPMNTWGMYILSRLFGNSEFPLRIPNLIAYLLYLFSSIMFIKKLRSPLMILTGFFLINVNPMLLDYFPLARGYGIALGFQMVSAWLCLECFLSRSYFKAILIAFLSIIAATLTTFSNFTFVHYYVALCFSIVLMLIIKGWRLTWKKHTWGIINSKVGLIFSFIAWNTLIVILFVGRRIIDLKIRGYLYAGGTKGFWKDTVLTLIEQSFGPFSNMLWVPRHINLPIVLHLVELGTVIMILIGIYAIYWIFKYKQPSIHSQSFGAVAMILYLTGATIFSQSYIFDMETLVGRTGLLFIPLMAYSTIFVLDQLVDSRIWFFRIFSKVFCILIILFLTINYALSFTFKSAPWPRDVDTKEMLHDLFIEREKDHQGETISLGADWILEPTINYYIMTRNLTWLKSITRDDLRNDYDYYYYIPKSRNKIEDLNLQIIKEYPFSRNRLAKKMTQNRE